MAATLAPAATDRRAVAGWVLYDLANTIFSLAVVSLHFPLWVVNDRGGRDGDFGLAASLSMALVLVASPFLGALSDQASRRMPFLIVATLGCCAATAFLGLGGLAFGLTLFVVANLFYQSGLIFYDSLLPTVSTEENRGTIGGLGVGLGYLGSFIGIGLGLLVLGRDPGGRPLLFALTALAYLLLALPCFAWVREPARPGRHLDAAALGRAVAELAATARLVRRYPTLLRFLVGRIFYADAANTLIAFMGIYVSREIGFDETGVQLVLLVGIAAAVVGGLGWGRAVDRIGPKRCLMLVLGLWATLFSLTVAIPLLRLPGALFWAVAVLAGLALGGTWAADRPFMLRLTPPDRLGQFYGLYAMVGRFAAILGPLLWTAIVDWLGLGRPAAVASLLLMIIIAALILRPVSDARPAWPAAETPARAGP